MTFPSFALGLIIATLIGALFHLWKGGGPRRIVLFILLSWAGFWGGHFLAQTLSIRIVSYGPLNIGPAILGGLVILLIGHWLSNVDPGAG